MTEHFYHLKPKNMQGNYLLSLAELEKQYPKLAKEYVKIYSKRKDLLETKILLLDCLWKDVIFFSCLDPRIIFAALELVGKLDEDIPTILKFNISVLKNKEFCLFEEKGEKFKFSKCSTQSYKEESEIPIDTINYFIKEKDPLIFADIKHIVLKNNLDIRLAEEVKYVSLYK